jgi:hypothetical protein
MRQCKGVPGNGDKRYRWRGLMEHSNRFKATHMRHENINDHQIESRTVEGVEASNAITSNDNLKAMAFEPEPDCLGNKRIVVNNENAWHNGALPPYLDPYYIVLSDHPVEHVLRFLGTHEVFQPDRFVLACLYKTGHSGCSETF